METNQIHRAEQAMAGSDCHRSASPSFPTATVAWLTACLLILLGVAFELGMMGFGPYNPSDAWLFSVISRNLWIMLTDLGIPGLRELVRIWPLMLVSLGSAILLISQRWNRSNSTADASSGRKENHAN